MRKNQKQEPKPNFKIILEATKEKIVEYWESILTAIGRYGTVMKYDTKTGTIFIKSESNLLSLAGRLKDALRSISFGLDVYVSKA